MANALWTLGILFWAVPVTFTQAIANLSTIEEKAPWVPVPAEDSVLYGIIQARDCKCIPFNACACIFTSKYYIDYFLR
jgi:hypothetical protein